MSIAVGLKKAVDTERKLKINLNRIKSAKTLAYLKEHGLKNHLDLDKILPVCYLENSQIDFLKHSKSYSLPFNIEDVWDAYVNIPPSKSWAGRRIGFSFTYNTESKNFHYANDEYRGLKENQLIFIEIKILFGLLKLAVTHHVNEVLPDEKRIKLCYVEGGKSSGSQMVSFEKVSENETKVVHDTYYKSDSKFRDEKLYPILHERIINQFHKNVKRYLAAK
ncbi:hypothetical protein [Jiulongibacter sp. NS-SX5]|uniref:hypothetical protein n=1 Tax=Jiulongibacter sp. NS-SX5 TaxID=3463854 RepID=UPI004059A367